MFIMLLIFRYNINWKKILNILGIHTVLKQLLQ